MANKPDPIRILELRSVWGTGGGPEKTILLGTARTDPTRYRITVCYMRQRGDPLYTIEERARELGVDYVEIEERWSFDPRIWTQIKATVRDRGIELVHAHEYKSDLLAYLLSKRLGTKALATAHGYTGNSWKEKLYYAADKRLLARFPRVITVSEELRSCLLARGAEPERVTTILNAIDPDRFHRDLELEPVVRAELGIGNNATVLGSVGRIEHQKRFDLLLDTFAEIRAHRPELVLLIAGEGSLLRGLRRKAETMGIGDACRFLGHVEDIPRFHHALDLFVQSSDYEGTPNVVLEAMALNTPIVATSAGGTADLVRDGTDGWIVPVGDTARLRLAVEAALDSRETRNSMAANARRSVETVLSFETRMKSVERIYDEMLRPGWARQEPKVGSAES